MLGDQICNDNRRRPGESHVAVDNHQASASDCSVNKLRGAMEIPRGNVIELQWERDLYLEMLQ